jgi:amidase
MNVQAMSVLMAQLRTCADDLALVNKLMLISAEHVRDEYLGVHFAKAHNLRLELRNQLNAALADVDVLVTPTAPHVAFELRAERTELLEMIGRMVGNAVFNTCPLDLTGHPALSVPAGLADRDLPFGLQIIGPAFSEALLYQVGAVVEDIFPA